VPLGRETDLSTSDIVLDGDPAPLPEKKGHKPPIFGPCLLWPNGWTEQDVTWYRGRPRPQPHCARWGPSSPKKGHSPQFSARVCCGQTAGWIKVPLGGEVDLIPSDIVLDGDPAPLLKKGVPPISGPCLLWSNGWMDHDATRYGGRPRPRPRRARWGPSFPQKRNTAPNFPPISVVAKRLDGSGCRLVGPPQNCPFAWPRPK